MVMWNFNRKLDYEVAAEIREKYFNYEATQYELSEMYNVSQVTIWRILNKKSYIKNTRN